LLEGINLSCKLFHYLRFVKNYRAEKMLNQYPLKRKSEFWQLTIPKPLS